jgi:hypothetical protein
MSERLLEALREQAERTTPVPAFELIEEAGRARRRHRRAIGGAVAACLLATTGLLATTTGDTPGPRPADQGPDSSATPWPGSTMTTVEPGTYEFRYSPVADSPLVHVTVPRGWNAWVGPNRFDGLDRRVTEEGEDNEDTLAAASRWYAVLLPLEVHWVAQPGCGAEVVSNDAAGLVRALRRLPGMQVTEGPTPTTRGGHPAWHLRLRADGTTPTCSRDSGLATTQGAIGIGDRGYQYDAWVIEAGTSPLLLWAAWSPATPERDVSDLLAMVASVELRGPGHPASVSGPVTADRPGTP